jgi:predicted metal-binding membrane protein
LNPRAWTWIAIGALLTLAVYALHEFAASIEVLSPNVRVLAAVIALGVAYGFAANRVRRAIEFEVWSQTP